MVLEVWTAYLTHWDNWCLWDAGVYMMSLFHCEQVFHMGINFGSKKIYFKNFPLNSVSTPENCHLVPWVLPHLIHPPIISKTSWEMLRNPLCKLPLWLTKCCISNSFYSVKFIVFETWRSFLSHWVHSPFFSNGGLQRQWLDTNKLPKWVWSRS